MPAVLTIGNCAENGETVEEQEPFKTRDFSAVTDPSDVVQVVGDGRCQETNELLSFLSFSTLDIVCVGSAVAAFLCVVLLMGFWMRRRHHKTLNDLAFRDSLESKIIKSAPASRMPSPKLSKCKTYPEALSASTNTRDVPDDSVICGRAPNLAPHELTGTGANAQTDAHFDGQLGGGHHVTPGLCHSLFNAGEPHYSPSSCGCLWFSVMYAEDEELLYVNLVKAENLPGRDNSSQYQRDPFVKMYLMPNEKMCKVSEVKKNTLNPVFNEIHTFQVPAEDIGRHMLRFSVYDVDKRRLRHCLGHVVVCLKNADLAKGQVNWSILESTIQNATSIGELQFSLLYISFSEKIKISVHNARNLKFIKDYFPVGVYVRAELYYGHKLHSEKHTRVHQGEPQVAFNESLVFKTCGQLLGTCNLKISVMLVSYKPDLVTSETEYGRVVVGTFLFAHGDELAHWQEMLTTPDLACTRWHTLVSLNSSS